MKIQKISAITGKINEREIAMTDEQYRRWVGGKELIQHIFPELSADDREFLISGATPEEWEALFGDNDEADIVGEPVKRGEQGRDEPPKR